MNKWLVGLTCAWMGLATAMGQATLPTTWSGPWTNSFMPSGWVGSGLGADYSTATGGYDATGGGAARFDGTGDMLTINFDSAPGDVTYWPRLNVGSGTWTTNIFTLQESANGTDWSDVTVYNAGNPIPTTAPTGPYTSTPSATARYLRFVYTQKGNGNVGIDGVTIPAGSGVVSTNVKFSASSVAVDEDQGIYEVTVLKTVASGDISGQVALSGTATYGGGADYTVDTTNFTLNGTTTSAVITVTINDDGDSEAAETVVMDLANVTGAATGSPSTFTLTINASDIASHAIAIVTNAPENGTVTTTPAGTAAEGQTVTVTATPAGGYAVQSIAVVDDAMNPVTVTGSTFTMPAADVTVTVTFVVHVGSDLIISEVVDPSDDANGRYVEIYNAGAAPIDLAAGQWYLARQANGTTWANIALTGTVGAAQAYVVAYSATSFPVAYPTAPAPNQYNGNITGNGDDGYFLYSGGNQSAGILEDSYGVLNQDGTTNAWEYTDGRAVRNADVTAGNPTWTALEWTITRPAGVAAMTPGVHPDGAAVFGVTFNKASGFTVEQGTSDSVVATAANGVAPYSYSWTSTLGEGYRTADTNVFTILATAPIGDYSAEVVATDSDAPAKSVTNSLNFSVVAPPTKYAIAIVTNNPGEGTVTTTPATEAAEGVAVTINITPADGYRAASVAVNGGAVAVVGNAFTMPAEPVTVTVTFEVYDAPDLLIDFETNTTLSGSAYTAGTSLVNNVSFAHQRVLRGSLANDRVHGTYAGRFYPQGGTNGLLATTAAFAEPISKISFWHANYGTDNGTTFKVQVSPDGAAWEDVGAVIDPESTTLTEVVLESVPANATYIQFVTVAGTARVNVDDIGLWFGEPVFGVSVNKANGFTVNEGSSDTITATAANGTPPYAYSWSSTLGGAHYATNANVFTILATAPTGSYSATVTATDATNATAQKTVTFSVVGLAPGQPAVLISGNLSGTVGVQMDLSITVTNETANDWLITLKDPDGLDDYSYGFVPPAFTLTPTKSGTYVLTAEAQTGSGNFSNTVNLAVSGGGGDVWQIGNAGDGGSMFYALTNITIVLPTNYTLYAVYGSDTTAGGINGWPWPLVPASNYTWNPGTRTLTLPTSVTNRRIYRIGATP